MRYLLGIDIGSYSSKGVLLDEVGTILATAQRKHDMRVPGPGLAEHDALEDWWEGFRTLSHRLILDSGITPAAVAAVGCSGRRRHQDRHGHSPEQAADGDIGDAPTRVYAELHHQYSFPDCELIADSPPRNPR